MLTKALYSANPLHRINCTTDFLKYKGIPHKRKKLPLGVFLYTMENERNAIGEIFP
jgi:hypothetical protein